VKGIEPSSVAWKATALPLSYTRAPGKLTRLFLPAKFFLQTGACWPVAFLSERDLSWFMKAAVLTLILIAGLALRAGADLTILQSVESGGKAASVITMKLKGDKARMEIAQITTLLDGKTGEVITLMNAQKKFVRISGDKAKAIAEMASKYSGATAEKPTLTATGRKETINGYETEEYVSETPKLKASYWIALKYPDSAAIMKQLQAATPTLWNDVAKGMLDYHDLPGIALRTKIKMGNKDITSTITSIKQDPLSDADFAPPADFQELKIPNVKEMSADQPGPAPSVKP
jgi:hypothetical protein